MMPKRTPGCGFMRNRPASSVFPSIEDIDPEIEFFDQGLDSMSVTELISQLETLYHIEIDPDDIFDYPLIDQFIDHVYGLVQES